MVKAYKQTVSNSSVEELGMELIDTNMNMNFVVSQIDSIQRLSKNEGTKTIKKNKPAFKRILLENVNGEVREHQSEPKIATTSNAFDSFMQDCQTTPKTHESFADRFSPDNFLTDHADKFQSCEKLDKCVQNLDKTQ